MGRTCQRHLQFYGFLDKLYCHVIEAGKTLMALVDSGNFSPRESMSKAEQAIRNQSAEIREDYAEGRISASTLLKNAALHFCNPDVHKEMAKSTVDIQATPNEDEDPDDPTPATEANSNSDDASQDLRNLEPEVVLDEPG